MQHEVILSPEGSASGAAEILTANTSPETLFKCVF